MAPLRRTGAFGETPVDFTLSEAQRALRESVRRFARGELPGIARRIEEDDEPAGLELRRRYAELGYLGVNLPARYGGGGLGHLEAAIVLEEIAGVSSAVAFPVFESCFGPCLAIAHFGPDGMKEDVLPKVCSGDMVVAVSMSEPDAGTALTDLATRARTEGGRVLINGAKRWCSGAGHAEAYVVYCRMSDAPGAKGIGAVLVPKDSPGLGFGARDRHMGFRGVASADMHFDEVAVPERNVLAPAGGFRRLMGAFDLERCGNAVMSLAIAASALDFTLEHCLRRRQFGKPLVDFQAVQLQLAEMKMKVDAARLLLYRAVANAGRGLPAAGESAIAKCFANEAARDVAGRAVQLAGGYGYSKALPLEQKMRDAWGWGIAGGAVDIQKVNIAAALAGRRFNQRAT